MSQNLPQPVSLPGPEQTVAINYQEPESPFSPEISDIMSAGGNSSIQTVYNALRSHSVPVQQMFTYQDSQDQEMFQNAISGLVTEKDSTQDFLVNLPNDDLSNLLQEKLNDETISAERGIQMASNNYNARKNLTELLESKDGGGSGDGFTSGYSRGDHMISGASVRMTQLNNGNCGQKMQCATSSYPSHSVPTPPSSHNASPDFSSEMVGMMDQSGSFGLNRGGVAGMATSAIDTPNSLDTVTHQDAKEHMGDTFFTNMYETNNAAQPTLETNQQMAFWD